MRIAHIDHAGLHLRKDGDQNGMPVVHANSWDTGPPARSKQLPLSTTEIGRTPDRAMPSALAIETAVMISEVTFHEIADVGHLPSDEPPAQTATFLQSSIERLAQ